MEEEGNKFIFENDGDFTILIQENDGEYMPLSPGHVLVIDENKEATYSICDQQFRKVLNNLHGSEMAEITTIKANRPPTPHRNWTPRHREPQTRHKACLFTSLFLSLAGLTILVLFAHFS